MMRTTKLRETRTFRDAPRSGASQHDVTLPEYVLENLRPMPGVGVDLFGAVDNGPVAARFRLEVRVLGRHIGMHRYVVVVAEHVLAGARDHEIEEQPRGIRMRGLGGDAGRLQGHGDGV